MDCVRNWSRNAATNVKSESLEKCPQEASRLVGQALGTDLAKVMELQEDGVTLLARASVGWKPGLVGKVTVKADKDSSEGHGLQICTK